MNFVKVICVCELHVFFHQYVADLRDERSETVVLLMSALNVVLLMSALRDSQPEGGFILWAHRARPVHIVHQNLRQGPLGLRERFPSSPSPDRARPTARFYSVGPLGPTGFMSEPTRPAGPFPI